MDIIVIVLLIVAIIFLLVLILCSVFAKPEDTMSTDDIRANLEANLNFVTAVSTFFLPSSNLDLPIFYINLDRSPDRNQFMRSQLTVHAVPDWTRISGVDGQNDPSVEYTNDFRNLSSGEIGCTLSHLRAIYTAYHRNCEYALILEDDASFSYVSLWPYPLSEYVRRLEAKYPKWQILQLYSDLDSSKLSDEFVCPSKNAWITLAYIIRRSGMKRILRQTYDGKKFILSKELAQFGVADWYIYKLVGFENRYLTQTPLFLQCNLTLPSTIHDNHDRFHLTKAWQSTQSYIERIFQRLPPTEELFVHLAEPQIIYQVRSRTAQLDIVLAYFQADIDWIWPILDNLKITYRLFVYSKGGQPLPKRYRKYIYRWTTLKNIGRCDHSYVYHIISTWKDECPPRKHVSDFDGLPEIKPTSSRTLFIKDSSFRPHDKSEIIESIPNWFQKYLEPSDSSNYPIGPCSYSPSIHELETFQLRDYGRPWDQRQNQDPFLLAPKFLRPFPNWARYVNPDFQISDITHGIGFGVILFTTSAAQSIAKDIWIRAGLTLSYGPNIETGHFIERAWWYLLSRSNQ